MTTTQQYCRNYTHCLPQFLCDYIPCDHLSPKRFTSYSFRMWSSRSCCKLHNPRCLLKMYSTLSQNNAEDSRAASGCNTHPLSILNSQVLCWIVLTIWLVLKLGSVTTSQRGKKRTFKLTSKNSAPKTPQDITTKSTTIKIMMEGKEEKKPTIASPNTGLVWFYFLGEAVGGRKWERIWSLKIEEVAITFQWGNS